MSFTCQSSFGPPAGHCLRRPLSDETPVRSGPRHCGQSEVEPARLAELLIETAEKHKQNTASVAINPDFTVFSFGGYCFGSCRRGELRISLPKCFVTFGGCSRARRKVLRLVIWSRSQQLLLLIVETKGD